ncbi:unnamed protein product [Gongylonema pulchrum]|uniref:Carrier domain-containing protein n=1 Tax=Gongylonema pulchrum TaxID=637853 RepID=A0A183EKU1_9BILA|nr:unnamed protein product [Gongylonema pulchrum]
MQKVKEIWCQLLGTKDFGPHDEFFAVGGHSLTLVLLRNKIREQFGFELQFDRFYKRPTLLALIEDILMAKKYANTAVLEKQFRRVSGCTTDRDHHTPLSPMDSAATDEQLVVNFVKLRENSAATGNLYMIHAIAGTIYPYYGILASIPESLNVYAIEYDVQYPSTSLMALASFYCRHGLCNFNPFYEEGNKTENEVPKCLKSFVECEKESKQKLTRSTQAPFLGFFD